MPVKPGHRVAAATAHFPTPPCASSAALGFVARLGAGPGPGWFDPCAGRGALLDAVRRAFPGAPCAGRELSPDVARGAPGVVAGSGLTGAWPAWNVVANPPFEHGVMRAFAGLIAAHARRHGTWALVLGQTQFWQSASALTLPPPDWLLMLSWRPPFVGKGGGTITTSWAVWAPGGSGDTRARLLRRPGG